MKKSFGRFLRIATFALTVVALVGCGKDKGGIPDKLKDAYSFVNNTYADANKVTASDYNVIKQVPTAAGTVTVSWTVKTKNGNGEDVKVVDNGNFYKVDVNENATVATDYELIATLTLDGESVSLTFDRQVPIYRELNFTEFCDKDDKEAVAVKGVVSGIISSSKGATNECLYVDDIYGEGGYYVYQLSDNPVEKGIQVGQTVVVNGIKDTYSGTLEITNASVTVVDESIKTIEPVDYTEKFAKASKLTDQSLVKYQADYVEIDNVVLGGQETGSGYYYFSVGKLQSYIRISSSVCPMTKDEQTAFKALHAASNGALATVRGVVCVYSGAFYLTPVDGNAITVKGYPDRTNYEKVVFEKANLDLAETKFTSAKEVTLPSTGVVYDEVKVEWIATNRKVAKIVNGNKLVVTMPEESCEFELEAFLSCGYGATAFKKFTCQVVVNKTPIDVANAMYLVNDLANNTWTESEIFVRGKVSSSEYSSKYGNYTIWLTDGVTEKAYELYGATFDEKVADSAYETKNALVGCYVSAYGFAKKYVNGSGAVTLESSRDNTKGELLITSVELDMAHAKAAIDKVAAGSFTGKKITVTGVVASSSYSASYGSYTIWLDGPNKNTGFELYSAVAANDKVFPIDATKANALVGYQVTCTGYAKNYSGTYEVAYDKNLGSPEITLCMLPEAMDVDMACAVTSAMENKVLSEGIYTVRGEVFTNKAKSSYNDYEIWLKDSKGNKAFEVYAGVMDASITESFGADELVGKIITVRGHLEKYNSTLELTKKDNNHKPTVLKIEDKEAEEPEPISNADVTITTTGLPSGYGTNNTATWNGISFTFTKIADFGDGVQIQSKADAEIHNTTAFTKAAAKIVFKFRAKMAATTINNQKADKGCLKVTFGSTAELTGEVKQVQCSKAGEATVTEITCPANATFIKIASGQCGAVYLDAIEITYVK